MQSYFGISGAAFNTLSRRSRSPCQQLTSSSLQFSSSPRALRTSRRAFSGRSSDVSPCRCPLVHQRISTKRRSFLLFFCWRLFSWPLVSQTSNTFGRGVVVETPVIRFGSFLQLCCVLGSAGPNSSLSHTRLHSFPVFGRIRSAARPFSHALRGALLSRDRRWRSCPVAIRGFIASPLSGRSRSTSLPRSHQYTAVRSSFSPRLRATPF